MDPSTPSHALTPSHPPTQTQNTRAQHDVHVIEKSQKNTHALTTQTVSPGRNDGNGQSSYCPEISQTNRNQQRGPIQHIAMPGIQMTFSLPLPSDSGQRSRDSRASTPTHGHSSPPGNFHKHQKMAHVFHDLSTPHFSPAQAYPSPTAPYQEAGEKGSDSEEEHEEVIDLSNWVPLLDLTHASPYEPASPQRETHPLTSEAPQNNSTTRTPAETINAAARFPFTEENQEMRPNTPQAHPHTILAESAPDRRNRESVKISNYFSTDRHKRRQKNVEGTVSARSPDPRRLHRTACGGDVAEKIRSSIARTNRSEHRQYQDSTRGQCQTHAEYK